MNEETVNKELRETVRVVHSSRGRVRLHIPQLRGASSQLEGLRQVLQTLPGVTAVQINPRSGSILILHELAQDSLFEQIEDTSALLISTPRAGNGAPGAFSVPPTLASHRTARQIIGGALVVMGIVQLMRGNFATPGATAFWYAFDLLSSRE